MTLNKADAPAGEPITPADLADEGETMSNPTFKSDHVHIIAEPIEFIE